MKLYPAEDSIRDKLLSAENSSIIGGRLKFRTTSDVSMLEETTELEPQELIKELQIDKLEGDEKDSVIDLTKDAIGISSILVSDIWNKNDDVFLASELIQAHSTAKFKPINWMHRGSEIKGNETIGVMINSNLVIGKVNKLKALSENNLEAANKDMCSGKIHIKQEGILWSSYFPSYSATIYSGFAKGELFVSVETFFEDFDYAIAQDITDLSSIQIISRTKKNAHYTKSLKRMGGSGKIVISGKEYSIGRVPRGLTISGQGVVDKPANTHGTEKLSRILDVDTGASENSNKNPEPVYNNLENDSNHKGDQMPDENRIIDELKAELNAAHEDNKELTKKLANMQESNLTSQLTEAKEVIATLESEKVELESKVAELSNIANTSKELEAQLEEAKNDLEAAQDKISKIEAKEAAVARLVELREIAGNDSYSDEYVDELAAMSEEVYEIVKSNIERLVKAGVSSQAKSTDQTVSSQAKSTDQTVSNQTKSTDASDKSDDLANAIDTATIDSDETADLTVSHEDEDSDGIAARGLVAVAANRQKRNRNLGNRRS